MSDSSILSRLNQLSPLTDWPSQSEEKTKIVTHTGEDSQPARIYFQVFNQKTVLGVFKKLRCLSYEKQAIDRGLGWRWFYEQEAKRLKFPYSYSKIPKEARPVVLGDFFFSGSSLMYLDVRSLERAIHAVEFFGKRLNPRAAKVTKIKIVNRLFSAKEKDVEKLLHPPYDHFFAENQIVNNREKLSHFLQDIKEKQVSKKESIERILSEMKEKSPEIEEIDFDPSEEYALERLKITLAFKNLEAAQHFQGNEQFSQWDLVKMMAEAFQEIGAEIEAELEEISQNNEEKDFESKDD